MVIVVPICKEVVSAMYIIKNIFLLEINECAGALFSSHLIFNCDRRRPFHASVALHTEQ
ncbi:hypothetical protein R5R35_012081 [Gryllus longicercus]|uniref:Uncharacterized protein n=1 Tax=Gryllus longicercus TaxID=2509291 RepID=A0AAN9WLA7_9ORTH